VIVKGTNVVLPGSNGNTFVLVGNGTSANAYNTVDDQFIMAGSSQTLLFSDGNSYGNEVIVGGSNDYIEESITQGGVVDTVLGFSTQGSKFGFPVSGILASDGHGGTLLTQTYNANHTVDFVGDPNVGVLSSAPGYEIVGNVAPIVLQGTNVEVNGNIGDIFRLEGAQTSVGAGDMTLDRFIMNGPSQMLTVDGQNNTIEINSVNDLINEVLSPTNPTGGQISAIYGFSHSGSRFEAFNGGKAISLSPDGHGGTTMTFGSNGAKMDFVNDPNVAFLGYTPRGGFEIYGNKPS
jgi:hypothetical protein